ncbi:MAG: PQQ-binding-like beta-propeller repeat protein [Thermoanaerobaculia bacterium]|nr:PQQ-binding-like beta-propeller repeat protein [Thermoanaerobaculia bacterium]
MKRLAAAGALALLTLPSLSAFADWPQFRGPEAPISIPAGPHQLEVAWKQALGSGYSNVSVAGGLAVTMFTAGENDVVAAFDAATGAERWRYSLGAKYAGHDGSTDGPIGTPTIADGTVYALGAQGALVALGLADGKERWRAQLDDKNSTVPFYGYTTSPLVAGDLVLVATGGAGHLLTAYDRATGKQRWARGDDGITYQTPLALEVGGRRQIVVVGDFFLTGLDPRDGSVVWQKRHTEGNEAEGSAHATAVGDGRFLVKYDQDSRLYRLGAQGPEELWKSRAFANTFGLPVYHDGHFYGFTGRFLTCVRASDGEILWRSRPPGGLGLSLVGNLLAVVDPTGALVLVEPNPTEYREVARVAAFERGDYASPSYAGGRFFLRNLGEIAAVRLVSGGAPTAAAAPEAPWVLGELARWVAELEKLPAGERQARVDARFPATLPTPVTEPGGIAHFVWRGQTEDVGLSGDVAPPNEEIGLRQVAGTDLWLRSRQLDPAGQYSYRFSIGFGEPTTDPKNPATIDTGNGLLSELRMPDWPAAPHLESPPADHPRGTLDGFPFRSESLGNTREIKVWRPADYSADPERRFPLLVVNHGDNLLRGGLYRNILDNLVGTSVEPIVVVFVPRAAGPEYGGPGVEGYASFLVDELIPHLERHYRLDPKRRAITGPASAGVTSLFTALAKPGAFFRVAIQSYYTMEPAATKIAELLTTKSAKPELVHVVWSRYDYAIPNGPQAAEATEGLLELLRAAKVPVVEVVGTHSPNWGGWRGQHDDELKALFPAVTPK